MEVTVAGKKHADVPSILRIKQKILRMISNKWVW